MKKILLFPALLLFLFSNAQTPKQLFGPWEYFLNGNQISFHGSSVGDSTLILNPAYSKFFKPFFLPSYAFTSFPSASTYAGCILYATDSLKPYYSNGSTWTVWGTGGGGGGSTPTQQAVLTAGNIMTQNNSIVLAGYTWDFSSATRSRHFEVSPPDSTVYADNYRLDFVGDSVTEASNGYYPFYSPTASAVSNNTDYTEGKYIGVQASTPYEMWSRGFNLKPNGTQRTTSIPAIGDFFQTNYFTGSQSHYYYAIRTVNSSNVVVDAFKIDAVPALGAVNNTSAVSSFNLANPANPTGTYSQYFNATPGSLLLTYSHPLIVFKDTGYLSNTTSFQQNGPDFAFTFGRNANWTTGSNTTTFTAGSISLNSAQVSINGVSPTAYLTIAAGTAAANHAPIKLTSGPWQTNTEAGAIEFYNDSLSLVGGVSTATRFMLPFLNRANTWTKQQTLNNVQTAPGSYTVLVHGADSGLYQVPSSSFGANYQTVQNSGSSLTQRAKLNFTGAPNVSDNSSNGSTDVKLPGNIFSQTALGTSVTGTTAMAILGSGTGTTTFGANTLQVGETIVWHGFGVISSASTSESFSLQMNSSGVAGWTVPSSMSNVWCEIYVYMTITTTGSSGTAVLTGTLSIPGSSPFLGNIQEGSMTVNTTISNTFTLKGVWGSNSSSDSYISEPVFTVKIE